MSGYWMPLLKRIELNQNRINEIPPLNGLVSVDEIIIANNNICDLDAIVELKTLKYLKSIELTNNPIINEESIELEGFNSVHNSNNQINSTKLVKTRQTEANSDDNEQIFQNGIAKVLEFIQVHKIKLFSIVDIFQNTNLKNANAFIKSEESLITNLNQLTIEFGVLHNYVIKLRHIFEVNDLNFIIKLESSLDLKSQLDTYEAVRIPSRPVSSRHVDKSAIFSARLERIKGLRNNTFVLSTDEKENEVLAHVNDKVTVKVNQIEFYMDNLNKKYSLDQLNKSAARIQSRWKGYRTRKDIDTQVSIMAATIIQSRWRGYAVRKRMKIARERLNKENDEFDLEEIDLNQFEFDEAKFDLKVPIEPTKPPLLPINKANFNYYYYDKPPRPPSSAQQQLPPVVVPPKKAWKGADSSRTNSVASLLNDNNTTLYNNINVPNFTYRSLNQSINPDSEAMALTGKHENVLNEWGFRDHRTAMLMLQRAEKMKYRVERKNKIKSLDPKQRLKFLRKFDKYTPRITSRTQQHQQQRTAYQNEESDHDRSSYAHPPAQANPYSRTFEWVHAQVRDVPISPIAERTVAASNNNKLVTDTKVATKLPHLNNNGGTNVNGNNLWRKGSSGNSSLENANPNHQLIITSNKSTAKSNKLINTSTKQQQQQHLQQPQPIASIVLPPLKINYDFNKSTNDPDQFSLGSSRSSFTQMFLNQPKQPLNNKLTNKTNDPKRRKKT